MENTKMAKTAVSLTIDNEILNGIKKYATSENRSLSNFTEVIFKEYLQSMNISNIRHSFDSAKTIGQERQIKSFEETNADLKKNVYLSSSDEKYLKGLQNK